jgi:hypothetical protein
MLQNIESNSSSGKHGGGVYVDGGTFYMTGGTITENNANLSGLVGEGGGVYATGAAFNMPLPPTGSAVMGLTGGSIINNNGFTPGSKNVYFGGGYIIWKCLGIFQFGPVTAPTSFLGRIKFCFFRRVFLMKRRLLFLLVVFLALSAPVFAQTAAEIETLLSTGALSYEQAASFVLRAADVEASGSAFSYASEQKWLSGKASSGGTATLDEVSLLIMGAFGIKGGIMYSAVKSPHYAYRELVHQGIIQGRADPGLAVSGDLLLFMVGRILDQTETEEDNL